MKLHSLAATTAAALALAAPATTTAEGGPNPMKIGFQVQSVDTAKGQATGIVHCAPPEVAGKTVTLAIAPGIDTSQLFPGAYVGVAFDDAKTITLVGFPPCSFGDQQPGPPPQGGPFPPGPFPPGGQPQGGQPPQGGPFPQGQAPQAPGGKPGQGPQGAPGGPGGDVPHFMPGFANRVWKFGASADGFEDGKLSITVEKLLNLPKKFANQDDDLVDEDAIVLVGKSVKVRGEDGKRADGADLADADSVVVQGKLLPPNRWQKDEDGQPVTTIRAKRITITG